MRTSMKFLKIKDVLVALKILPVKMNKFQVILLLL
jgi:hypothetical protein